MVNRLPLLGFALLLAGCPEDLGQDLGGTAGGLGAPLSLQGTPSSNGREIYLSWQDQSTNETGYRLEISPGPFDSSGSLNAEYRILPAGATTYTFASMGNQRYYFRIYAVTDTMESAPSNEISILTPYALAVPGYIGVEDPRDGTTSFILKWGLVDGATGYQIEYMAHGTDRWLTYPSVIGAGVDRWLITGLLRNTTYYLRVTALGPYGNSPPTGGLQVNIVA